MSKISILPQSTVNVILDIHTYIYSNIFLPELLVTSKSCNLFIALTLTCLIQPLRFICMTKRIFHTKRHDPTILSLYDWHSLESHEISSIRCGSNGSTHIHNFVCVLSGLWAMAIVQVWCNLKMSFWHLKSIRHVQFVFAGSKANWILLQHQMYTKKPKCCDTKHERHTWVRIKICSYVCVT